MALFLFLPRDGSLADFSGAETREYCTAAASDELGFPAFAGGCDGSLTQLQEHQTWSNGHDGGCTDFYGACDGSLSQLQEQPGLCSPFEHSAGTTMGAGKVVLSWRNMDPTRREEGPWGPWLEAHCFAKYVRF